MTALGVLSTDGGVDRCPSTLERLRPYVSLTSECTAGVVRRREEPNPGTRSPPPESPQTGANKVPVGPKDLFQLFPCDDFGRMLHQGVKDAIDLTGEF
jgi:hypothetical protein